MGKRNWLKDVFIKLQKKPKNLFLPGFWEFLVKFFVLLVSLVEFNGSAMSSTGDFKQEPFRLEHSKALFFVFKFNDKNSNKALRSSIYATTFRQALKPRITYSHCACCTTPQI